MDASWIQSTHGSDRCKESASKDTWSTQKKRVMKEEETYSRTDRSDNECLAEYVGHLRVKRVINKSKVLKAISRKEMSTLHERVTKLNNSGKQPKERSTYYVLSRNPIGAIDLCKGIIR